MATYPQGVTDFIPDYQPYQPDLTTTANVLQLKQTQYDQNWESLNRVYGQIYNAQLTHDQSISNRDEMVKQIDFNLRRVSGLDLSLDQNVDQATQVFRPFYEDSNLMKDMAWSKNTSSEIAMGKSKKLAATKEEREQYWEGGLRKIDYKIQEFKDTPYDQLSSVPNVSYTPYVNVSKAARELAEASNLSVDFTEESPDNRWLIRQKNGEPLIGPLQNLFYSELGSDPAIKEFYDSEAYLARKDNTASTLNSPEFKGDAIAAEKKYLSSGLEMLKTENQYQVSLLKNEKNVYEKKINDLENMISNGTSTPDTPMAIANLKKALGQTTTRLKGTEEDLSLVSDNLDKTRSPNGSTQISMDDLNDMRFRVDNAMASGFMQAAFDDAAKTFAYTDYVYDKKPNPFQVNLENHGYRMTEQDARAKAAWDLTLLKQGFKQQELEWKAKMDSGSYIVEEDKQGNVQLIKDPTLNEVHAASAVGEKGVIGGVTPKEVQKKINDIYGIDPNNTKNLSLDFLRELNDEGVLSDQTVVEILGENKLNYSWANTINGFMNTFVTEKGDKKFDINKWVEKTEKKKSVKTRVSQGFERLGNKDLKKSNVKEAITVLDKMFFELSKPENRDNENIKDNPKIMELATQYHQLQDYASYKANVAIAKEKNAKVVIGRLKAEGFKYSNELYDENWNKRSSDEFAAAIAKNYPNEISNSDGVTWSGFLATAATGATIGGGLGTAGGPAAVATVPIGLAGGAIVGGSAYLAAGAINKLFNYAFGEDKENMILQKGQRQGGFQNSVSVEYDQMSDLVTESTGVGEKSDWQQTIVGMPRGGRDGSGKYVANGAKIIMQNGVTNTDVFPYWNQLQDVIKRVTVDPDDENGSYVTINGVNTARNAENVKYGENLTDNAAIWKLLNNRLQSGLLKKDSKIGNVGYNVNPYAGGESGLASITISPENTTWLKQFVKTDKNPNGMISSETYKGILDNGLTLITDQSNLLNSVLYKNSYQDRVQARVESAGKNGVTYNDPLDPAYKINIKKNTLGTGEGYIITTRYKLYNPNIKGDVLMENVSPTVVLGKNLEKRRDDFFSVDVPEYKYERQSQYEQYRR